MVECSLLGGFTFVINDFPIPLGFILYVLFVRPATNVKTKLNAVFLGLPSEQLLQWSRDYHFDAKAAKEIFGLKCPLIVNEKEARDTFLFEPTMTVCGFENGYIGKGAKTIMPKRSLAKLDCRLVPRQDREDIFNKIRKYLDKLFRKNKVVDCKKSIRPKIEYKTEN